MASIACDKDAPPWSERLTYFLPTENGKDGELSGNIQPWTCSCCFGCLIWNSSHKSLTVPSTALVMWVLLCLLERRRPTTPWWARFKENPFFIGVILALQSAYELRRFGAMSAVATAVAISMSRELGPLVTAIVVIGRSGSAFAAEIGTMKVSEEIDALKTMAISPARFLVAPKFLAMMVMLPCLTIWATAMGILGGALLGVTQADFTFARYVRASIDSLLLYDVTTGLAKSVMFGITITAVGCLEGLSTGGGAEQVGRSTTRAVVMSIFLVVVVDLFFTALFFFAGNQ